MQAAIEQPFLRDRGQRTVVGDELEAGGELGGAALGRQGREAGIAGHDGRDRDRLARAGGVDDARAECRRAGYQRQCERADAGNPPCHGECDRQHAAGVPKPWLERQDGSIEEVGADATAGWPFRRSFHVSS